jgi:hypothetical protein
MRAKVFAWVIIVLLTAVAIAFILSYTYSRHIAVQYLRVLSIHDNESYQRNKALLYKITGDEVFNQAELNDTYKELHYRLVNITCRAVKGFYSFTFIVTYKIQGGDTVTSLIQVKGYQVFDAYREEINE